MEMTPAERVIAQKLMRMQKRKEEGVPWCAHRAIGRTAAELGLARERVAQVWADYCQKWSESDQRRC